VRSDPVAEADAVPFKFASIRLTCLWLSTQSPRRDLRRKAVKTGTRHLNGTNEHVIPNVDTRVSNGIVLLY
jgi:hypothetical protein